MVLYCKDCRAEILDASEDSMTRFCRKCLGLEHLGIAVFSIDPEAKGTDDYIDEIVVAKVGKKKPFVVQLSAEWRDEEDADEIASPLEPIYLTKTAAQKLITLLKKALADEAKPRKRAGANTTVP